MVDFAPMYMVEVFTKPGLDPQKFRDFGIARSGQCPAIYDNGIHYAIHQRLTPEEPREISNAKSGIEVTGDYCGGLGSCAPSHEYRPLEELRSPMI
jgi:hypothetical protein